VTAPETFGTVPLFLVGGTLPRLLEMIPCGGGHDRARRLAGVHHGFVQVNYSSVTQELMAKGLLVPASHDLMICAQPYAFSSPSMAVALDRDSSGPIEWKVKRSKQSHHEWQQAHAINGGARHG
jgi:hypothetical protein